ncbi:MFS transporter [Undibacterium sp. CY7W]|uniref:MFS transporter n=1 Tax=Undibacterium rugosum TaxID=2762291 RepID=A0A923I2W7_9BURK|nr:MFS transporter [Undibacterium rugosum]MBC3935502.1 MFS transporter [Undibacterium rugosum]
MSNAGYANVAETRPAAGKTDALIISLVGVAHGISHFFHMILAPLFPWIKEAFQLSYAELGLLMTVFFVISGIGQALSGFVVDRIGARAVLFFGISCLALSALLLSMAPSYGFLMLGAMVAGVGNSVFHPADYTLLNQKVTPARLGYAFSVHGITGNLGWASAPVFLVSIAQFSDWRTALLCASALPLVVLALLVWHRDLLRTHQAAKKAAEVDKGPSTGASGQAEGTLDFLKIPAVWMCFAFFFLTAMGLGGIQNFSATSLRDVYGMSLATATSAYTLYMLASAGGMLWGGMLAAKAKNHDRTIAMAFGAAGMFALCLATGLPGSGLAVVLMAAIGFGSGVAGPSRDLMIRAAAPKNATGRVYGIVYSGLDSGLACSPLLFGAIMDRHQPALVFVLVCVFQMLAILTAVNVGARTRARNAIESA